MNSTGLNARLTAIQILDAILHRRRALDLTFDASEDVRALPERDRAFARNLVATTLRRRGQIDDMIFRFVQKPLGRKGRTAEHILRIGMCQLLFLETAAHAAVSTSVDAAERAGQGHYKKLINAVLRRTQRDGADIVLRQDAARLNTPSWMWRSWSRAYGEDTCRRVADAHLEAAALDISCRRDPEQWAEALNGKVLPWGTVRLKSGDSVRDLPGFSGGAWWVQDSAARMAVGLLGNVSGKTVIDLCAAPGGKTLYLANAGAQVTAVDRSERRLDRLRENLDRLKVRAEVICADATQWKPVQRADIVLLDAPCSATGTLRRHPDAAVLKNPRDVEALAGLQSRLLDAAVDMVADGGSLVYCTCSLEPEEGPDQVRAFLKRNPSFRLDPIRAEEIYADSNPSGLFRSLPSDIPEQGGRDGFFAARLVRA